jgi:hypothetical protein
MFATLGIASLISLWFAIYITLVGIYRMIFRIPLDKGGTNKDSLSRYLYHTARVLLFVNSIIIFALIVDVFRRYFQYKLGKTDSAVGWGVGRKLEYLLGHQTTNSSYQCSYSRFCSLHCRR